MYKIMVKREKEDKRKLGEYELAGAQEVLVSLIEVLQEDVDIVNLIVDNMEGVILRVSYFHTALNRQTIYTLEI